MVWICGDGGTEKSQIGQKEEGGVDMRGWRVQKKSNQNRTEGKWVGWICGGWEVQKKSNQNRTEGSGWGGYAGMEVQKYQTKIGQKEVGWGGYAGMEVQKKPK